MVATRALVLKQGIVRQVPNTDSLIIGSGIETADGDLNLSAAGSNVAVASGKNLQVLSGNALVDGALDRNTAGTLSIGTSTATAINIGQAGVTTAFAGAVQFDGDVTTVGGTTFTTDATFEGNVTFGDVDSDTVSFVAKVNSDINFAGGSATYRITNMADPTNDQDAATKKYVDDALGSGAAGANTEIQFNNSGAFGASANFTFNSATDTLALTGTLDLNGDLDLDGASAAMDASGSISLDAGAASNFSVSGANLTLSTSSSGNLVLSAAGDVDCDAANATIDASAGISLDAAANSNFSVSSGATLTFAATESGQPNTQMTLDAADGIDIEAKGFDVVSNEGNIRLETINAGDIVLNATGSFGSVDIDAGQSLTMDSAGSISIDAGAASNLSVAGADLTLSTSTSGYVIVNAADEISFQTDSTARLVVGDSAITIKSGVTLGAEAGGMINLPAQFQIDGSAVAATVTAANLDDLTDGSNADALHYHDYAGSTVIDSIGSAAETLAAGNLVMLTGQSGSVLQWQKASADALLSARRNPVGVVKYANNAGIVEVTVAGLAPSSGLAGLGWEDAGKVVYMSTTNGEMTLTAPSGSGEYVQRVGIVANPISSPPTIVVQIGNAYILD